MDERYIDDLQVRKARHQEVMNAINLIGNNNTMIQGLTGIQLQDQPKQKKR